MCKIMRKQTMLSSNKHLFVNSETNRRQLYYLVLQATLINKNKIPNPLKIHLDQIFSFHLFNVCCLRVFLQLQNAPMYRRNAQVCIKGESYILPQPTGSDQLLKFSFSQRNKRTERVQTFYFF